MGVVVPKTPARPSLQIDVSGELRALREQGMKDVEALAELRGRVDALEGWKRTTESRRTATTVAMLTAVIAAIGSLVALLLSGQ